MDKKLNLKMLQDLTLANGISGFEEEAVEEDKKISFGHSDNIQRFYAEFIHKEDKK